jgi:N-acetylglucosamine kinase-like BadF-type ATPase
VRGYFLGVDTGGSKSQALVADERGQLLGFGQGGPGNWELVGWQGARAVLDQIIGQAAAQAGIERSEISSAGFGLAGYDWPEDRPAHEAIIHDLVRPDLPFELVNDALIALWAATDSGCGVVVAAGTSCNCYGRNAEGQIGRITGSSHFGEYAGAGELVWWAVQAVAAAWSLRGPATRLSGALVRQAGASDAADLLAGLMRWRYTLSADSAPLVFSIAADGDPVAQALVRRAGRELGGLALGVSRQLGLTALPFDVVLAGSFYDGSPLLSESMARQIKAHAPQARLVRLDAPPVAGATLLAMERAGINPAPLRRAVIQGARQLAIGGDRP